MDEADIPESGPQPLDGKNQNERVALARAILEAAQRGLYVLAATERAAINNFIMLTMQRRDVNSETIGKVNFLARQHKQNLIALTRIAR